MEKMTVMLPDGCVSAPEFLWQPGDLQFMGNLERDKTFQARLPAGGGLPPPPGRILGRLASAAGPGKPFGREQRARQAPPKIPTPFAFPMSLYRGKLGVDESCVKNQLVIPPADFLSERPVFLVDGATKLPRKKHLFMPLGLKDENEILFFSIATVLKWPTKEVNPPWFFIFLRQISALSLLAPASIFTSPLCKQFGIFRET